MSRCLVCDNETTELVRLGGLPALVNALWPSREQAMAAATGDLVLGFCAWCGLLHNTEFDPEKLKYSPTYDNSLHHSPRFREYATQLADRLIETHDLRDREIIEIGSGSADFLHLLCERGPNRGLGYDPSHDPQRTIGTATDRVRVVADYYPVDAQVTADFITSQHVLEHLTDPRGLLVGVRRSLGERRGVGLYLEVPDATYMMETPAIWDLIYEHVSYFARPSLEYLVRSAGFDVTDVGRTFGDQYLWVEATPASGVGLPEPDRPAIDHLASLATRFAATVGSEVSEWSARLAELVDDGPVAVWGAGSKGVTFLNVVPAGREVRWLIDVNPNKQGGHVPGTGHRVEGPEALASPRHVLVMNPIYADEIAAQLSDAGLHPEIHIA